MVKTEDKKKSERGDYLKNGEKIIKEVMKDPTQSQRDIASKVWVAKTTVQKHLKNLPSTTKSDHIEKILEKDLEIVNLATDILKDRLTLAKEDPESKMSTRDIIASADVSAKRYSLFKWDVTDKDWWLKEQTISEKQQQAIDSLKAFMLWS